MTKLKHYSAYLVIFIALAILSACSQNAEEKVLLQIENESGKSFEFKQKDFSELARVQINALDKEGNSSSYEGVQLFEVLRGADVKFGDQLRGKNMTNYLVVEGADGYRVSFALAEIDPDFSGKTVLLADTKNGKPLSAEAGELRLVVPDETKRQARWVRQVVKLKIQNAE